MSVVFMKKLEKEPATYEQGFTALTGGVNTKVQDWVLSHLPKSSEVLEFGPGPGTLAIKMAQQGHVVTAIEKDLAMLKQARANRDIVQDTSVQVNFQWGEIMSLDPGRFKYDAVVSTFVLSELRPLEQQVFLRKAWMGLKVGGTLLIADEFVPRGAWKAGFKLKRWWYKRKMRRLASGITHPLEWFAKYPAAIGFKLISEDSWRHGAIKAMGFEKVAAPSQADAGFYRPPPRAFKGIHARLRAWRCLLSGQVDHVAIEPGIYASGNPGPDSPVLVTANYDYTYIKVINDLARKNVDAWVLCVDSRGINVWCAARGGDFGNKQLLEAVQATGIAAITKTTVLILPQLSAGGIEAPKLPKNTPAFPFTTRYGPVWSKDLPAYLAEHPAKKPEEWKVARFTLQHRLVAGLTHFTFSARKIFGLPSLLIMVGALLLWAFSTTTYATGILKFVAELWLSMAIVNFLLLGVVFPAVSFTRKFIVKGLVLGTLNLVAVGLVLWLFQPFPSLPPLITWNTAFHFWIGFFSTMSFSGYSMDTSPREIAGEYVRFQVLNIAFLILSIVLSILGLLLA
nr:methyltransferase domain-containing protein [Candidatus Sigynarchaeota archaeon]